MSIPTVSDSLNTNVVDDLDFKDDRAANLIVKEQGNAAIKAGASKEKFLAEHPAPIVQISAQKGNLQVEIASQDQSDSENVAVAVKADGSTSVQVADKGLEISSTRQADSDRIAIALKTHDGSTDVQVAGQELQISSNKQGDSEKVAVAMKADGSTSIYVDDRDVQISSKKEIDTGKVTVGVKTHSGATNVQVDEQLAEWKPAGGDAIASAPVVAKSPAGVLPLIKTTSGVMPGTNSVQISHRVDLPANGVRLVVDLRRSLGVADLDFLSDAELQKRVASETITVPSTIKHFVYKQRLNVPPDNGLLWIVDIRKA